MDPNAALLNGKVAIVTGAGQGIGNGIAMTFAAFGADAVINDRNEETLEQTAKDIRALGRKAETVLGDIRDQTVIDRAVAAAAEGMGRLDILVNNVGGTFMKLFMDMTERDWARMLELNLVQCMRCIKSTAGVMIDRGTPGSIINVTTIEAFRGAPGFSVYAAAKAGLTSLTESLALELGVHGIRVNAIAPEATETPGGARVTGGAPRPRSATSPHIPLGRRGTPDDQSGAALYLASDLSGWVSGETIQVGGGAYAAKGFRLLPSGHWSLDGIHPLVYSGKPGEAP